ncbi:CYTH-like domain-containing protein [Mrakia frigida]|uniref:mRNA triphosphatase n=1 Tax=Mrakia frigida TaxID=29902 RepID=UPI003FCC24EA
MSSSDSSRKRPRTDASSDSHEEEEEERTNGHQIDPQQSNPPPPPAPAPQQQQYYQQQHQPQPPPSGPLQPSFFGVEPFDDFTRRVGDWIWSMSRGRDNVEIEAKVGTLRDSTTHQRIHLPVLTECILAPSVDRRADPNGLSYVFDSDMTLAQHKHFNILLNSQFALSQRTPSPILYSHLYETDTFHAIASDGGGGNRDQKVRVRRNKKTGEVVDAVEKVRLGDLNVFCPGRGLDWRLSCSVERPVLQTPTTPGTGARQKDRMSYAHQIVQVDLTQVTTEAGQKRHELEVEVLNVPQLLEEAQALEQQEDNTYDLLLGVMLASVRMLIKNSS